jgi:hypothetical protein
MTQSYQNLKNDILSSLYEDKDSLFYHLSVKKQNLKETRKETLLNILSEVGEETSFYYLISHLISKNDVDTLTELMISERASSSKKAILMGYDSCLMCKKNTACCNSIRSLDYNDKVNFLLYLRFVRAKKILKMLKWGINASCFSILLREPILMKFIANYALVVDIKNELKKEGKIAAHKTLYKGAGKYCPFDDLYMIT